MTEFNAQPEWRYLHFVSRVTASMVDCVLQILVLIPIVINFFPELLNNPEQPSQNFQWVAGAVQTVILLGFWLSSQSTPGKMLFHARIVDADTGAKPTTRQFAIRYAGISSAPWLFLSVSCGRLLTSVIRAGTTKWPIRWSFSCIKIELAY